MSKNEILEYVDKLDWKYPIEIQENAIKSLICAEDEHLHLIFDKNRKSTWKNAVRIIKEIGFPKNKVFANELFWLLQDINWPGAIESVAILSSFDEDFIVPLIIKYIKTADAYDDTMWIGGINVLIKTNNLKNNKLLTDDIQQILSKSDF